jgi:hypothetical protein
MLRRSLLLLTILAVAACSGEDDSPTAPGRGSLRVEVTPNPIIAKRVAGMNDVYDMPFDVVLTETGGETVTIEKLVVDVKTFGVTVLSKTYDASYLAGHNYSNVINAGTTVRYNFGPREEVPDAAFNSNVDADIRAEGRDAKGNVVRETKTVSLRKE